MGEEEKSQLNELSKKLDMVLGYLHNNDGTGELGLVARFKKHEEEMKEFMSEYKTEQTIRKTKMRTTSLIFGAIGTFLTLVANAVVEFYKMKVNNEH